MREIKFRGKRVDNDKLVYGHLIECGTSGKSYIFPTYWDANESERTGEEGCLRLITFEVIPETVGQYTGLKDKHGKEIYEGDIVITKESSDNWWHTSPYPMKIIYSTEWAGYMWQNIFGREDAICEKITDTFEVIDNIYENPELMEIE